jgi:hypothetical protein
MNAQINFIPVEDVIRSWEHTGQLHTFTGRVVKPLQLTQADIDVVDIAHALSNLCRFNGHCRKFYSVAEHSVRVARIAPPALAMWALMHDAAEAYLIDFPLALKGSPWLGEIYKLAERRAMREICLHFDLPLEEPPPVKHCDRVLLATELRDIMTPALSGNPDVTAPPLPKRIAPWSAAKAKREFLNLYRALS